jgi:hypothetical protein
MLSVSPAVSPTVQVVPPFSHKRELINKQETALISDSKVQEHPKDKDVPVLRQQHKSKVQGSDSSDSQLHRQRTRRFTGTTSPNAGEERSKKYGSQRSVSFGNELAQTIIPIEHLKKIPKREISKRWFSTKDFASIRCQNESVLQLMEMGCTEKALATVGRIDNTDRWSTRGLERQTAKGMTQYYEQYRDAINAVLERQRECINDRKKLDEIIAYAYHCETAQAQNEAVLRGLRDAKEVRDYVADCNTESVRQAQQVQPYSKRKVKFSFLKRFQSVRSLASSSPS